MNMHEDLFEARLKGTLPSDAQKAFDKRIVQDATFAQEFRTFRSAYDLTLLAGEERLRARLATFHPAEDAAPRGRVIPLFTGRWLAVAATVVLAIGAVLYFQRAPADPQKLFAENMSAYAAPDRMRDDAAVNDAWSRFGDLYSAKRYDDALPLLDSVTPDRAPQYLIAFYRAQCLLLKNEPDPKRADFWLNMVLTSDNDLHDDADWYIALCDLKSGDAEQARYRLQGLRERGYKKESVEDLLRALGGS